ncbi:MAG: DUF4055 domain-containing protein [Cyanobacteria bacterium J06638_20]
MADQNAASLPNYLHPTQAKLAPALMLLLDTYEGLYDRKKEYLPRAQKEPEPAYKKRVAAAVFNNKLRPIIDSNAGLLTAFDVSGLPPTLDRAINNVDMQGASLKSFVYLANVLGLRDRTCYVLTMQEPLEGDRTLADERENPRRPYWSIIDRRNILNWRVIYQGGRPIIQQVTILMEDEVQDGTYGTKLEPRYHVLSLVEGGVQHEVLTINKQGEVSAAQPSTTASIPRIPLVAYPDPTDPFSAALPEFLKAAQLNIKLFRQEATLDNIQYRVNAPTFWRRSSLPIQATEGQPKRAPFVVGENYVIELMASDSVNGPDEVGVLEISGEGIAALAQAVTETKEDIEAESLGFLGGSSIQRTATEAYLSGAQMSASLNGKARSMSAALTRIVEDWCMFTGEDPTGFAIEMDHSLLEQPLDAQEMNQLLALRRDGQIDHRTLLELLRMGRQLPPSADIDEILERVETERSQQTASPIVPNGLVNPLNRLNEPTTN